LAAKADAFGDQEGIRPIRLGQGTLVAAEGLHQVRVEHIELRPEGKQCGRRLPGTGQAPPQQADSLQVDAQLIHLDAVAQPGDAGAEAISARLAVGDSPAGDWLDRRPARNRR
jgi:hypothetical protein